MAGLSPITGHQYPFYIMGEAPLGALSGQLLSGGSVEAGIQEAAEAVVREICNWHKAEEFL